MQGKLDMRYSLSAWGSPIYFRVMSLGRAFHSLPALPRTFTMHIILCKTPLSFSQILSILRWHTYNKEVHKASAHCRGFVVVTNIGKRTVSIKSHQVTKRMKCFTASKSKVNNDALRSTNLTIQSFENRNPECKSLASSRFSWCTSNDFLSCIRIWFDWQLHHLNLSHQILCDIKKLKMETREITWV